MTSPRPIPTKIGIGPTGTAHLAFADNTLSCNEKRSLTGKITALSGDGAEAVIAALLAMDIDPGRVCRRCLKLPQFRDRYTEAWASRPTAPRLVRIEQPDSLAPQAIALLGAMLKEGIARRTDSGAMLLDLARTVEFLHPLLATPVGTGGDDKRGALILTGLLNRNGEMPEPAHKPVPGVTGPAQPAPEPGQVSPQPITGGFVEIERRTATGEQQDGDCFDCSQAYNKGQEIVVLRMIDHAAANPVTLHTHCRDLRARAWDDPDSADQWTVTPTGPAPRVMVVNGAHATRVPATPGESLTIEINDEPVIGIDLDGGAIGVWPDGEQWTRVATLPGHTAPDGADASGTTFTVDTVALRAENERLTARCRQLEQEAVRARQEAAEAGGRCDAQAASLAELARMAEQARCHSADFLGDADFYTEGADKRRRDGLRYTMARHTELTIALSTAARGYAQPKPTDLYFPDLPALLAEHGWKETPARELTMHEDTRPQPMLQTERCPAWLRVWRRGNDHVAAWFTSPRSLDWLSCNTRGRLAEIREIEQVITTKDAGRKEPLGPPKPGDGDTPWDTTIDQVAAIMDKLGWTSSSRCDEDTGTWRFEWVKRGHGLDEHGRPREVRVYGIGRPGKPAVVWYWAGRITALPQLWRIAER